MSTLWYGVQGEGRGHASRSRVLIDRLRQAGHTVDIFTGGDAEALFQDAPGVERIPLLRFAYFKGRLNLARSILRNAWLGGQILTMTGPLIGSLSRRALRERPDLVISDFEPFLCRVGRRAGLPVVCIDHQHAMCDTVLPTLEHRADDISGRILSRCVPWISHSPLRVVSSFHHFPRAEGSSALLVGCFLGPRTRSLMRAPPFARPGVATVYAKEAGLLERILPALRNRPETFEVWSAIDHPETSGNISLRPLDSTAFLDGLASSEWFLTTAGNQGLGEALALGKPVLAMPVPGQTEQEYNGLALEASGCGQKLSLDGLDGQAIDRFLRHRGEHLRRMDERRRKSPELVDGTEAAWNFLLPLLSPPCRQERLAA